MTQHPRRLVLAGLSCLLIAGVANAQEPWPARPVKIIVPFSAGTGLDIVARGYAEQLAEQTKGSFVVENRDGAGGTIGTMAGAHAPADGYTIVFTAHGPFAIAPYMQAGAGYDPVNDFVPITKVASIAMVLITGHDSGFKRLEDVAKEAKAHPGKVSFATTGVGTPSHLNVEVIKRELGLDMVAVPYKNTGQAMSDVIGNRVPLYMPSFPAAKAMISSGQVRGLAIGSASRSPLAPDIPTLAEAVKKPGLEALVWYGFLAPKGTAPAVVARWNTELVKATDSPKIKELFAHLGAEPSLQGPQEFKEQVRRDAQESRKMVEALNLAAEK